MSGYTPAKIYAAVNTAGVAAPKKIEVPAIVEEYPPKRLTPNKSNEIQVSAMAELSLPPDRCRILIKAGSRKDEAQEAKNSVIRRLDYILQVLNNHQIRDADININKVLKRIDDLFDYEAEVTVCFNDFNKCQGVSNFLIEKLDSSVIISNPEFYQSSQRLEGLRRQASITAVKNAKQKAAEIAQFLNAKVGHVISVREEYINETEGVSVGMEDATGPISIQSRMNAATVNVSVKVSASFELRAKAKMKNQMD